MNLYTVIEKIKSYAKVQPNMGTVSTGSIYDLNTDNKVVYPAFVITQDGHTGDNIGEYFTYNFNLFVVDREVSDKSNKIQVQSYAIEVLKRMVILLEGSGALIDNYQVHTFEEKFNDVCAGAYLTISLKYPETGCIEDLTWELDNLPYLRVDKKLLWVLPDEVRKLLIESNVNWEIK